jgi:hypothetical protein
MIEVSINQTTSVKILTQFLLEMLKITSSQSITNLNLIKGKSAITCGIKDERDVWLNLCHIHDNLWMKIVHNK